MKILQIHFPFKGPWGEDMARELNSLAESINSESGFVWKIWTENRESSEAGGIYMFEDAESAQAYLKKHSERLKAFGVPEVHAKIFDVNEALTGVNKGPLCG